MSVDINTLSDFAGKSVVLTYVPDDETEAVTVEGSIPEKAASPVGVAFKEKGKRDVQLIEPSQIQNIELAPEKPKNITRKTLKEVTISNVRQHLVDRHGYTLAAANALTDEEAFDTHNSIDHEGDDLGHKHKSEDDDSDESDDSSSGESTESEGDSDSE